MILYLRNDLIKSDSKTGQQRGGQYAARVQIGTEKDGSPKYRYFKTQEEYSKYLKDAKSKGRKSATGHTKGSGDLETRVKEEHEESKKKQRHGLLVKPTDEDAEKSLRLYVRI